jgi:hypothetical protein
VEGARPANLRYFIMKNMVCVYYKCMLFNSIIVCVANDNYMIIPVCYYNT